jgi:hypothetical protein
MGAMRIYSRDVHTLSLSPTCRLWSSAWRKTSGARRTRRDRRVAGTNSGHPQPACDEAEHYGSDYRHYGVNLP